MKPWTPERVVTPEDARRLASGHVEVESVELFAAGWDNTAYLLNGTWVFRFPRRALAISLMATENAVLPWLASFLPVPVPRPEHVGWDDGWPYHAYRHLPGRPLASAPHLSAEPSVGAVLGELVRSLHAAAPHAALGVDKFDKTNVTKFADLVRDRAEELGVDLPAWVVDDGVRAMAAPRPPDVVVHGDLDGRHVLVGEGVVTGIIDWGDVHRGHPATDLALAFSALEGDARRAFFATYASADPAVLAIARFRALRVGLRVLEWVLDAGTPEDVSAARRTLHRAVQAG